MKEDGDMNVTRNLLLEQAVTDKIDALNQPGLIFSSLPHKFLENSIEELDKTAAVNQTVYDFALHHIEKKVEFFSRQSSLIDQLHSFFTTLPPEVQCLYNNYLGNKKGAAYQVICRHLDPQFNPPWSHLNMGDVPGLLGKVDTLLAEITQQGMNSPIVIEFLQTLGHAPFF